MQPWALALINMSTQQSETLADMPGHALLYQDKISHCFAQKADASCLFSVHPPVVDSRLTMLHEA